MNGQRRWPAGLLGLLGLQVLVALLVFPSYLLGKVHFAFIDIGSDSFEQIVPITVHLARELQSGWPAAWSFNSGLGNANSGVPNPFFLIGAAFGADAVLPMRIWAYLLRIVLAGFAFYWLLRLHGCRIAAAIVIALSYSFSGFATVDGQWDGMSFDLLSYPLMLVGVTLFLKQRVLWPLPLSVALAIYCGTFVFALGLFFFYLAIASCLLAQTPKEEFRRWITGVFPLFLLGVALAAPNVIFTVIQILDSPRVTGEQSMLSRLALLALTVNGPEILRAELGGFFHKDLFGIGSRYRGWINYFEGPMFFVGMLPLLVLPQLWHRGGRDRGRLILAGIFITVFVVFPAIRLMTYGFALPYFRINNLWITLLLLFLSARALDATMTSGVDRRLLLMTALVLAASLCGLWAFSSEGLVQSAHVWKMLALIALSSVLLWFLQPLSARPPLPFLGLATATVLACAWVAYPAFNIDRKFLPSASRGYNDETGPIIQAIRMSDPDFFYRIEKTYKTGSFNDAMAQDYFGVKSYDFHGRAVTRLFTETGIIPKSASAINYTNWLPGFDSRFALNTLVGARYLLSRHALDLPGHLLRGRNGAVWVYENTMALPLGIVYERQVESSVVAAMPGSLKDFLMLQAAVVDAPVGRMPLRFDPGSMKVDAGDFMSSFYFSPAKILKKRGLNIESFSQTDIAGSVITDVAGVLVFSIPDILGWSVEIDGLVVPTVRVNYGFFGVPIERGEHRVVLRYRAPGLVPGLMLAALAFLLLAGMTYFQWRRSRRVIVHEASVDAPVVHGKQ